MISGTQTLLSRLRGRHGKAAYPDIIKFAREEGANCSALYPQEGREALAPRSQTLLLRREQIIVFAEQFRYAHRAKKNAAVRKMEWEVSH